MGTFCIACEQEMHFRSSLLYDRKCVCGSQDTFCTAFVYFAGTRLSLYHDQEAIYFILACKFYGQDMPVKICVFFAAKGYSLNKLSQG